MNGRLGIMQITLMKVPLITHFLKMLGNLEDKIMEEVLVNLPSKDVLIPVVIQIMNQYH